jgi:CRP-like cAMP-binding protein
MGVKTFKCGDIIFRQGDPGDCMYDIQSGQVDIYVNYGGEQEKKIAQLFNGELFGEMGVLDDSPRSATAVAGSDDTEVVSVSKKEFGAYFLREPVKILNMMQQMSDRLRNTTRDYLEACQTVYESEEADKTGAEKSEDLKRRIRKFSDLHKDLSTYTNS